MGLGLLDLLEEKGLVLKSCTEPKFDLRGARREPEQADKYQRIGEGAGGTVKAVDLQKSSKQPLAAASIRKVPVECAVGSGWERMDTVTDSGQQMCPGWAECKSRGCSKDRASLFDIPWHCQGPPTCLKTAARRPEPPLAHPGLNQEHLNLQGNEGGDRKQAVPPLSCQDVPGLIPVAMGWVGGCYFGFGWLCPSPRVAKGEPCMAEHSQPSQGPPEDCGCKAGSRGGV